MKTLGLDIGTTTISAVVVENKQVIASKTLPNQSFLRSPHSWEKIQDPHVIRGIALEAVEALLEAHPDVAAIGVTGQMHGILYLDAAGTPVSPLYTWQDGRGDLPFEEGLSYAQSLTQLTGYPMSTGFGFVTHFYNEKNHLVPQNAAVFCTIHDYIAMLLTGNPTPVTDPGDGASFGLFRVDGGCFDEAAIRKAGMAYGLAPKVVQIPCIGYYKGKPVSVAIGDNQASFLGATGGRTDAMVLNMGTGGQISIFVENWVHCPGLETRPFPGGGYLLAGSSLCGGRAYALLEQFLAGTVESVTGTKYDCYGALDGLLGSAPKPRDLPRTAPLFQGTREDPTLRGSITGLTTENFTLRHLAWSMLEGMAAELHELYLRYEAQGGKPLSLIGSGNGLRKNVYLQQCCQELFGQPLTMSGCREEAAAGAALYAKTMLK